MEDDLKEEYSQVCSDMPMSQYISDPAPDPSLTATAANALLATCPARVWYDTARLNPDAPATGSKPAALGTAVHSLLFGDGSDLTIIEADSFRTKAAREARDAAYAENFTPILADEFDRGCEMAEVLRSAAVGLACGLANMAPEQTIVWRGPGKVYGRCRPDGLWNNTGTPVVVHLKTTRTDISDSGLSRYAVQMGWPVTHAHYSAGIRALTGQEPVQWFLVQEQHPPYLARLLPLDGTLTAWGEKRWKTAWTLWGRCVKTGHWPGYGHAPHIEAPAWLQPIEDADDDAMNRAFPDGRHPDFEEKDDG